MNPLFIAHIIADFLLQPKWLVSWKEKSLSGIAVHCAIHAAVMSALVFMLDWRLALVLIFIAAIHGVIDSIKINYIKNSNSFELAFFFDQGAHLIILAIASLILKPTLNPLFQSENGEGMLYLLFLFSFVISTVNLTYTESYPIENTQRLLTRLLVIIATFALFFIIGNLSLTF